MSKRRGSEVTKEDLVNDGVTQSSQPFTGVARSVQAYDNQGFRNFRIVTLHIEYGMVMKIEYSDAYANFEAISRMELWNEKAIWNLNSNWKDGRTLSK